MTRNPTNEKEVTQEAIANHKHMMDVLGGSEDVEGKNTGIW
jgi:hypothetical protein